MKTATLIPVIILSAILTACGENKQPAAELITIDVNANYPEKELVKV